MEIKVGVKVFLKGTGNNAGKGESNIKEGKIDKIGKKYFYVGDEKFDIKTLKYHSSFCNSGWVLYWNKQDILDEDRKAELNGKLREFFMWYGGSKNIELSKLEEIAKIAEIE